MRQKTSLTTRDEYAVPAFCQISWLTRFLQVSNASPQQGHLRMSTDDSISEDVSSSGALGHDSLEESGGKESEASIISFEDSPSGLACPEEEHPPVQSVRALQGFIQAATGVVKSQDPSVPKLNSGHKSRFVQASQSVSLMPFMGPEKVLVKKIIKMKQNVNLLYSS